MYRQSSRLSHRDDFDHNIYQLNFSGDLKLWRHHRSLTTLHYGWISGDAPPQELFSLGGMTTLPGYPDDSFVGPKVARASQAIYLNASSWVGETSVLAPLRMILTINAGKVWENNERFETADMNVDVGCELDYKEILRFGVAVPVGPRRAESPRVYIGWGQHVW